MGSKLKFLETIQRSSSKDMGKNKVKLSTKEACIDNFMFLCNYHGGEMKFSRTKCNKEIEQKVAIKKIDAVILAHNHSKTNT